MSSAAMKDVKRPDPADCGGEGSCLGQRITRSAVRLARLGQRLARRGLQGWIPVLLERGIVRRGERIGGRVEHQLRERDRRAAVLTATARRPRAGARHRAAQGGCERGEPLLRVILTGVSRRGSRRWETLRRSLVVGALRLCQRLRDLERQNAFADHLRSRRRVLLDHNALL